MKRTLAIALPALAIGFTGGYLPWRWHGGNGELERAAMQQASTEYSNPISASCGKLQWPTDTWDCTVDLTAGYAEYRATTSQDGVYFRDITPPTVREADRIDR